MHIYKKKKKKKIEDFLDTLVPSLLQLNLFCKSIWQTWHTQGRMILISVLAVTDNGLSVTFPIKQFTEMMNIAFSNNFPHHFPSQYPATIKKYFSWSQSRHTALSHHANAFKLMGIINNVRALICSCQLK